MGMLAAKGEENRTNGLFICHTDPLHLNVGIRITYCDQSCIEPVAVPVANRRLF